MVIVLVQIPDRGEHIALLLYERERGDMPSVEATCVPLGGAALLVGVDEHHVRSVKRQARGDVDGGCGLTRAALRSAEECDHFALPSDSSC